MDADSFAHPRAGRPRNVEGSRRTSDYWRAKARRQMRSESGAFAGSDVGCRRKAARSRCGDSYAECNRIARGAHSSFYLAFFGLPRDKRNALFALYAFMRLIDNVSDEPGDLEAKRRGLARWRGMLDEAIAGETSGHAILPALADSITRFSIPTRYFHDLILGAEMDLTVATYATFDQLSEYCYRVAGTVGLTCLHVFGFRDPRDPDLAERLGLAFQLTNIIRDVKADLEMGRVYLPQEDLERFGCTKNDLQGPLTQGVQALLEFRSGTRLALLRRRRRARGPNRSGQPRHFVGACAHVQHAAGADGRAPLRCVHFARFPIERGKSSISPRSRPRGKEGRLVEG